MTSDRHNIAPYPLRLQPELRARLEEEAKNAGRSLHAEITARLDRSFAPDTDVAAIAALAHRIAGLDSSIIDLQEFLQVACVLGKHIVERIADGAEPSDEELRDWHGAFSMFIGTETPEERERRAEARHKAAMDASLRLRGILGLHRFEPDTAEIFRKLADSALNKLPPADHVLQQSDEERHIIDSVMNMPSEPHELPPSTLSITRSSKPRK